MAAVAAIELNQWGGNRESWDRRPFGSAVEVIDLDTGFQPGMEFDVLGDCFVNNADSWSAARGPAISGHG